MSQLLVTVESTNQHFTTNIKIGNHSLVADEPLEIGGSNKGPAPAELLLASLGSYTAITLQMYASHKQIPLSKVSIQLSINEAIITRTIHLSGNITPEQKEKLLTVANKCPVHKLLTGTPLAIETLIK